jgi:hypothetical protein
MATVIRCTRCAVLAIMVLASAAVAGTGSVTVTPLKGQSADQTARDQADCGAAATSATGYDPNTASAAKGERAKSAAKGAAVGAAAAGLQGGEVYDRAGDEAQQEYRQEKAADAAKVGAVAGGHRQRKERRDDRSTSEAWDQSYRSCLSGRGYSVK